VPALGMAVQVAADKRQAGDAVTLAIRPEKMTLHRDRPTGPNVVGGQVRDLAYFGKDSLYRVALAGGDLLLVHAVNATRGDARPDWDDRVWVRFEPTAALLLEA
jgi:putrescine transport system ATP-binding protein